MKISNKKQFRFFNLLVLVAFFTVVGVIFLVRIPVAIAACSIAEPSVANTLSGITPSSQTLTNPSSIFLNASGYTAFKCINGTGFRTTTLSWIITNSIGQTMVSDSWNSPATWDNEIAAGAVNYDGTPLGFVNGYAGTNVDVSSWPAGTYTLTYTSDSEVDTVGTVVSLNSTLTITRPLVCTISSFTCDSNATLNWSTANCDSASIDWGIGAVPVPTGSKTNNTYGRTYTLTAINSISSMTSPFTCPAAPTLTAYWNENSSANLNKAVTPGQTYSVPFTFKKAGSGSLRFKGCYITPQGGETTRVECLTPVGAEIPN